MDAAVVDWLRGAGRVIAASLYRASSAGGRASKQESERASQPSFLLSLRRISGVDDISLSLCLSHSHEDTEL